MIVIRPKQPEDVLDYALDWSDALSGGDAIQSYSVAVTGATKDSDSIAGDVVTVWISGGTSGSVAKIVASAVTVAGRHLTRLVIVPIRAAGMGLVTEREARLSLRLGPPGNADDDDDLANKMVEAESIFLAYHGAIDESWIDETTSPPVMRAPEAVKAAVIGILHALWDERGRDPMTGSYPLMRLIRGPALA